VYRAAHTLRGAVSNFGAAKVVEQARALEMMGRSGDISQAGEASQSLRALIEGLEPELKAAAEKAAGQVST
jgi:HPt (histidine-containing phosphotransfer) domain-containing protein